MRISRQGVAFLLLNKNKYLLLGVLCSFALVYLTLSNQSRIISGVTSNYWGEGQHDRKSENKPIDLPPELAEWKGINTSLWRNTEESGRIYSDNGTRRLKLQQKWVEDLSRSDYFRRSKKKRILITGGYNLNAQERRVECHKEDLALGDKCEFVEDLWSVPNYINYDEYDAVLNRRNWNYQFYEPRVPPGKLVFFDIQESPYTLHQGDFRINNPLLVSYWRGSDILATYGKWWPYSNNTSRSQGTNSSPALKKRNYAVGKTKLVAMVASHCPTYNDRLGFVAELQKFIPVDVYGSCGPFECDRKNCMANIQRDYKFYLAFENANCRDYITEKFFQTGLGGEILPVVLGAHPDDYKAAAPPNSYIHVEDFKSPRELAEYLRILDRDDDKYNEYFEWKGTGEIKSGFNDALCRVCGLLHYAEFFPPTNKWRDDAYSWLKVNPCLKPKEFYWKSKNYAFQYPGLE